TLGVELPLSAVLGPATVASVAEAAERAATEGGRGYPPLLPAPRGGDLPVSFPQERVLFVTRLAPDNLSYQMQATLAFRGALEVAALEGALSAVVARHEVFRTTFHEVDGRGVQRIHAPWTVSLPPVDFTHLAEDARKAAVDAWIAGELARPMDLASLPLVRWTLLKTADDEHVLVHVEHHIIHDGWSFNLLLKEVLEGYRARVLGETPDLPPLPLQYADFCVWQREWMKSDAARAQLDFWRRKLGDSNPVLDLPLDRPRPPVQRFRGAAPRFELPGGLYRALSDLGHAEGATLFQAMLAGFAALMARYAGTDDLNVGTGIAARRQREVEGMIGMFVNSLVVRADLRGAPSFRELIGRVRGAALEAYAHQDVPFDAVVEAVRPERHLGHNPLFQVMFSFHDSVQPELALPGVEVELLLGLSNRSAKFDMTVIAIPRAEQRARRGAGAEPDGITLIWEYDSALFDAATVERMFAHFRALLERAAAAPDAPLASLELFSDDERRRLLEDFNDTRRDYPAGETIPALFEAAAGRNPDGTALVFHGERTTYRALDARANRIAHHLRSLGVGPETLVAVCMERGPDLVAALLGVLKAGGAYVPVDPAYPAERIGWMLEDAGAPVVLTTDLAAHALPLTGATVVRVDTDAEAIDAWPSSPPEATARAGNLAYAIYTSGSTGRPKGVQIEHRSAVSLLRWLSEMIPDAEMAGVLAATSVSFDVSVAEIFGTLVRGGTIHLVENALSLAEMPAADQIRRATMVPSAAAELLRMGAIPPALRSLGLGGEPVPPALSEGLHALGTLERIENLYGPTEDTTYSTCWIVPRGAEKVLVGRPVANTRAYVLDDGLRLVPQGAAGELYLAGDGVARGYGSRPALTSDRFVPCPFGPPGSRMYRVGDRVRWTAAGEIEYLGRLDQQVKVRGFRVEPGEVEAALLRHPEVEAAAVVARPGAGGPARLVAYVVARDGVAPGAAALREHLRERLPDYMVPSLFARLDALPRTPNGKVDRRALPAPEEAGAEGDGAHAEPRTETEREVAALWAEVLGVERVGVDENFFDLGGHSLLAMQVLTRLRDRFGVDLPLREAFERQTVESLARAVDERAAGGGGEAEDALARHLDGLSDEEIALLLGDLR
ncbi:MAG TPA: amino acid adenylation domain-containing protein, partial [Longimicrobium sp.]|nr:amino acid adenylation domain-containing protein [Longimicrobium sp.]